MTLTQSMEDYLEAIYEIDRDKVAARVKDVAEKLGVTMPSVNAALKNLEAHGLITHRKYEYIELTAAGRRQASGIASKHQLIYSFLADKLGVEPEVAEEEACRIEHVICADTARKLADFIESGCVPSDNVTQPQKARASHEDNQ